MKSVILFISLVLGSSSAWAGDHLVQVNVSPQQSQSLFAQFASDSQWEDLGIHGWYRVRTNDAIDSDIFVQALQNHPSVSKVQENYRLGLFNDFKIGKEAYQQLIQAQIEAAIRPAEDLPFPDPGEGDGFPFPGDGDKMTDNPEIPSSGSGGSGADPLFNNQWGMHQAQVQEAWKQTKGSGEVVVAVIDTGIDYTHEDLVDNLWRNPGETGTDSQGRPKATNGVDDDSNGFVDDSIGWDFVSNDNKPFDLALSPIEIILQGGNPGHGTHCAGNVAARGDNGKGVAGVAPNVKIMGLRFLSEKGQGTTADAIKAIRYAVDNGAHVLSNSWGSVGEDPNDRAGNEALKDAIRYSEEMGRLFVAAAGNGKQGVGYNNDTDSQPAYPASYPMDIIVSVAAIDESGNLGSFSNWGARTVDIGAPGVKVFSTTVGSKYSDTVVDLFGMKVTWDGTSMATPHVAGAAALYLSKYPNADWRQVKQALLAGAKKTSQLSNKTVSGGQLDVSTMLNN